MTRPTNPSYSNGTGTKENIRAIEQDIERHQKDLAALSLKLESASRTNWNTLFSAVGVFIVLIAALWGLAVLPLNADAQRLERGVANIQGLASQRGITFEGHRVKFENIEATIGRFRDTFRRMENEFATIKDFNSAATFYLTRHTELQNQISSLTRKIDEVFPPQKTLEDLTRRLAELERTRLGFVPPPSPRRD